MNQERIMQFKQLLLDEHKELLNDLMNTSENFKDIDTLESGDLVDQAFNFYEKQLLIDFSSTEKQRIEDINIALEKIANKTFGICEICKLNIDEKRLEAIPYAKLCMDCKKSKKRFPVHNESY